MLAPTLILAPLRGFTGCTFRTLYARFFTGIDGAVAPFIPSLQVRHITDNHIRDVLPENNPHMPVIPQVIGKSAGDFIRMAARLFDRGHGTVNWNLGCPFPVVVRKGRGCGMLPFPDRIDAFLDEVLSAIPNRLTIKTRLGLHDPEEIFRLIPILNAHPLASVIIHPRTGSQMYDGRPDESAFCTCLQEIRHPVIYNGDISCLADFRRLSNCFPEAAGWMIGRGVLTDPFLPATIRAGADQVPDKKARFRRFHDALFSAYGERLCGAAHLLERMKGYWQYFGRGFADSGAALKQIRKCRHPKAYLATVHRFLDQWVVWRPEWAGGPETPSAAAGCPWAIRAPARILPCRFA